MRGAGGGGAGSCSCVGAGGGDSFLLDVLLSNFGDV